MRTAGPCVRPPGSEAAGAVGALAGGAADGPELYLHPGQIFVSAEPHRVTTILGSCVSVCMWDGARGIGGLNHFLLPHWAGDGHSSARFGNVAIRMLVDGLVGLGVQRRRLQAKVFGGACVMEAFRGTGEHLGVKNVEVAARMLHDEGVDVVARDVGGRRGRKLIFQTNEGSVWMRLLG